MSDFVDIGGGLKQFVGSAKADSPLDQAQQILGIRDLAARIQQAPVDAKIKEIEMALKGNQLLNADVDNLMKNVQLKSALNDESRKQTDFFRNTISSLPSLLNQSPELAAQVAKSIGISLAQNKDGTFTGALPGQDGSVKAFTIDSNNVADPEKKAAIANNYRDEWTKAATPYRVVNTQFNNLQKSSNLATAQGDISMIFALMKMEDPNSSVREGEADAARKSPGASEQVRNMYERAIANPNAPFFGPAGSRTRTNFIEAAKALHENTKADTISQGKFFVDMASRSHINPKDVLVPVGIGDDAINFDSLSGNGATLLGQNEPKDAPKDIAVPGKPAKEASVFGSMTSKDATPAPGKQPIKFKNLDDLLNQRLLGGPPK